MARRSGWRRRRGNPVLYWLREQFSRRPLPVWIIAVSHVLALGIALVLYALPHHVIPHAETAVGIVSSRNGGAAAAEIAATDLQEDGGEADAENEPESIADESEDTGNGEMKESAQGDESLPGEQAAPEQVAPEDSGTETAAVQDAAALEVDGTGSFRHKFADKFTDGEVVRTDESYISGNINVTMYSQYVEEARAMTYVADVYVADVSCLMTAFARDQYGRGYTEWITDVAERYKSVVTLNGDYYGCRNVGVIIRNGVLYRDRTARGDIAVLYWDGHMEAIKSSRFDTMTEIDKGAYQSWSFGPSLLDEEGKPLKRFNCDANLRKKNPRSAIGYFEPGHYCLVAVDGRNDVSHGATMTQLANIMSNLGCKLAYNLDGGQTSLFCAGTKMVNDPSQGGRDSSDYIMIVDRITQ
ncbi:MAG: phosphodiester glycosidase family protein [Clostridia bacterium]|nr:phosphodiester glycosidase family protein [Clostridia bacterium]